MKSKLLMMILLFAINSFAQESAYDREQTLTLEQEKQSENYIHQGKVNKQVSEDCSNGKGGFNDICTENRFAFKEGGGRNIEAMLPMVTKAYSMIMMVNGSKFNGKAKVGTDGTKGKPEQKNDYCRFIPAVGEAYSIAQSQIQNTKTQQNYAKAKSEARQAASFYALAKTHKDQAKASKVQMGVWGAAAGCYAAYLASGSITGDWKLYAKLGASTLVAAFYKKKASAHKRRSAILTKMAKDLPQAGDCNPFTETSCFCNEETSFQSDPGNYNQFCVPTPFVARNQHNDASVCINKNGKSDPDCECKKSGTCIDRVLKAASLNIGIPPTLMRDPLAGIKPITSGFGSAGIDAATNRNIANAKKALKKFKPATSISLNNDQKKYAAEMNKLGIPKAAAAMIAKRSPSNSSAPKAFSAGLGSSSEIAESLNIKEPITAPRSRIAGFKKGGNAPRGRKARSNNPFGKFRKKRGSINEKGFEIHGGYAKKALAEAEITMDPGENIFEVINKRYQVSGWRRFPEAFKVDQKLEKNQK